MVSVRAWVQEFTKTIVREVGYSRRNISQSADDGGPMFAPMFDPDGVNSGGNSARLDPEVETRYDVLVVLSEDEAGFLANVLFDGRDRCRNDKHGAIAVATHKALDKALADIHATRHPGP